MIRFSSRLKGLEASVIRQMNQLAKPDTINLGIGQLPYDPPQALINAGIKAFESKELRYTSNPGLTELREIVALEAEQYFKKTLSGSNVIITLGVEEGLWLALSAFLDKDDEILIPEVYFSPYETIPSILGAKAVKYKLDPNFGIDNEDLESKISSKTKLVLLNSPSNPTGHVCSEKELKNLAELLNKHEDIYVVSDEVYSNLVFDKNHISIAQYYSKTMILNGLSKRSAVPGLRMGWVVADEEIINALTKLHQYIASHVPNVTQKAAIPVLEGKCRLEETSYFGKLQHNSKIVYSALMEIPSIRVNKPMGAFYVFPDISEHGTSKDVAMRLFETENVLVIPGIAFGERGGKNIRISYASEENILIEALGRMKRFFNK